MEIKLENISKKFNKVWLFKNVNYAFNINKSYAITGLNGSGKSTLLQIIAGFIIPNEGKIFIDNNETDELFYQNISLSSPALELIEEMTAIEFLSFHFRFKKPINNISINQQLNELQLSNAAHKQIRYFSSGMKQRLKLAQAIFSDTKVLLLDEPCSNLDKFGVELYHALIKKYTQDRIVIICSNDENEYSFCNEILNINYYQ